MDVINLVVHLLKRKSAAAEKHSLFFSLQVMVFYSILILSSHVKFGWLWQNIRDIDKLKSRIQRLQLVAICTSSPTHYCMIYLHSVTCMQTHVQLMDCTIKSLYLGHVYTVREQNCFMFIAVARSHFRGPSTSILVPTPPFTTVCHVNMYCKVQDISVHRINTASSCQELLAN